MIEMCTTIKPYVCTDCQQEMLFFNTRENVLLDYKKLFNRYTDSYELKKYLYPQNITKLRCFVCRKEYFIDWRRGYPVQASVPEINSNIGGG